MVAPQTPLPAGPPFGIPVLIPPRRDLLVSFLRPLTKIFLSPAPPSHSGAALMVAPRTPLPAGPPFGIPSGPTSIFELSKILDTFM